LTKDFRRVGRLTGRKTTCLQCHCQDCDRAAVTRWARRVGFRHLLMLILGWET